MRIEDYFEREEYLNEKSEMPIMQEVISRMEKDQPFKGEKIAIAQLLVINSTCLFEALWRGGANLVIANPYTYTESIIMSNLLIDFGFTILPLEEAALFGDWYVDVAGRLGEKGFPKGAIEVTRTGEYIYQNIECPTISVDSSRTKYLEDYMGTGESFVRGWYHFFPNETLRMKKILLFGYGKVGRGVANFVRKEGANVVIAEIDPKTRKRAVYEGYQVVDPSNKNKLKYETENANIIIGATGIKGAIGQSISKEWIAKDSQILTNIGIDEFGENFDEEEILGGKETPINWHLDQPTKNRYIDPIFSALILAMEELIQNYESYKIGLNKLPQEIDQWIIESWVKAWPDEDISNIFEA